MPWEKLSTFRDTRHCLTSGVEPLRCLSVFAKSIPKSVRLFLIFPVSPRLRKHSLTQLILAIELVSCPGTLRKICSLTDSISLYWQTCFRLQVKRQIVGCFVQSMICCRKGEYVLLVAGFSMTLERVP